MRSMCEIHLGKEKLNVASHKLRVSDCQFKSLNYVRAKQVAHAMDKENASILKSIKFAKTGVPSKESLESEWQKTQRYRGNLKQSKYNQSDIRQLLHRRQIKLGHSENPSSRVRSPIQTEEARLPTIHSKMEDKGESQQSGI